MNFWALTDIGLVRSQNQDTYFAFCDDEKKRGVFAVFDGMGGAKAGNIASVLASSVFSDCVKSTLLSDSDFTDPVIALKDAASTANNAVFEKSVTNEDYTGMGTTLVTAFVSGRDVIVLNVGDSRAYVIDQEQIRQITRDHSVVEDMVACGDITREEAKWHPKRNIITRALGTASSVICDVFPVHLEPGSFLLLCSDGLSGVISDEEIRDAVLLGDNLEVCCERVLKLVQLHGAPDNVTMILYQA